MTRLLALLLLFSTSAFGAFKDYVPGFAAINAVSMAASITSSAIDVRGWDNVDIELIGTGTPTGTVAIDCSLMPLSPPAATSQTWVAITLPTTPAFTGTSSNIMIELLPVGCMFLRIRYVRSSGTGTLTAYVSEKQI